jgi:integrase
MNRAENSPSIPHLLGHARGLPRGQFSVGDRISEDVNGVNHPAWASRGRCTAKSYAPLSSVTTTPPRLHRLDAGVLNGLYSDLLRDGRHDGQGLSPRSVHYIHTIIHRALRDAVRWGRMVGNPADVADPPRHKASESSPMRIWTPGELRRFLELSASTSDRYLAAWHLLSSTGLRRGEALGLRWTDVDLETGQASVRQTVIAVGHEVRFGTPKAARGRRSVSLDTRTVTVLREHRRRQLEERLAIGVGWRDHDPAETVADLVFGDG